MAIPVKDKGVRVIERLAGSSRWSGITNIASGDTTVVVSATSIKSGQPIIPTLGITSVASHQDLVVSVNSLVTNTSMVMQVNNAVVDEQQVCFMIIENI